MSSRVSDSRKRTSIRLALPFVLLAGSLLAGTILRIYGAAQNPSINSDEGISLLAATGHLGDYEHAFRDSSELFKTWTTTTALRTLVLPEDFFCFGKISTDLVNHDTHPPLYFWILHVWLYCVGVHPWSGIALNLIFFLGSSIILHALVLRVSGQRWEAASAVGLWACSPMVVQVSYEMRQYELLTLTTLLFTYIVIRCTDRDQRCGVRSLLLLAVACAAGLLTHYHFVIAIVAGAVYGVAGLIRRDRKRLLLATASIISGLVLAMTLHPVVQHSSVRVKRIIQHNSTSDPAERAMVAYRRYRSFVFEPHILPNYLRESYVRAFPWIFISALSLALTASCLTRRRAYRVAQPHPKKGLEIILFFSFCYAGGNIFLYVSGVSPGHAMAAKYPCMAWPLLGAALAMFVRPLPGRWHPYAHIVAVGMMIGLSGLHLDWTNDLSRRLARGIDIKVAGPFIIDNANRLRLPRLLVELPSDAPVLVAPVKHLTEQYEVWTQELGERNYYIGFAGGSKKRAMRRQLMERLLTDFRVNRSPGNLVGYDQLFEITRLPR